MFCSDKVLLTTIHIGELYKLRSIPGLPLFREADTQPQISGLGLGNWFPESSRLVEDFRRVCEAYLVEYIIEKTGGIKYDDDPYYVGLTLYRRGLERAVSPEQLKDKADAILLYLHEKNRIEMGDDRVIRTKSARKRLAVVS